MFLLRRTRPDQNSGKYLAGYFFTSYCIPAVQRKSYIRHEDFIRPFVRPSVRPSSVRLTVPPLDSEMGWTGELWSKTKFLILENLEDSISIFFSPRKNIFPNFQIFKKKVIFWNVSRFFQIFGFFQIFWIFFFLKIFIIFWDIFG